MQGKTLVALVLSVGLLALLGCGGDSGDPASTSPASGTGDSRESIAAATRRAFAEQQRLEKKYDVAIPRGSGGKGNASSPPHWLKRHTDSGGGAAQFKVRGADNSLPEYGEESTDAERDEAAASLHGFLDARAARQWAAACSFLSLGTIEAIERLLDLAEQPTGIAGCPKVLAALAAPAPSGVLVRAAIADVNALRVEGDRGFLLYHGIGGTKLEMPMVAEKGEWKVGSVEPVPIDL